MTDMGQASTDAEKERFAAIDSSLPSAAEKAKQYLWSVLGVALITAVGKAISPFFDITNVALFYLLPVLVSAVRWGRGPSLLASLLGVLSFDFFLCAPLVQLHGERRQIYPYVRHFSHRRPRHREHGDETPRRARKDKAGRERGPWPSIP